MIQTTQTQELPIVWIVTYWTDDSNSEPVVTPFINEEAAKVAYDYFKMTRPHACIDKCEVFKRFIVS